MPARGEDLIDLGGGEDIVIFRSGDGQDTYFSTANFSDLTVQIEGHTRENTVLSRSPEHINDLIISFNGSDDQIRIVDAFTPSVLRLSEAGSNMEGLNISLA